MRLLVRLSALIAMLALLCLVFPALNQRADAEPPASVPEPATIRAASFTADLPAQASALPAPGRSQIIERTQWMESTPRITMPVITDGNGSPLGSMTWAEAVWCANPPESIPGS